MQISAILDESKFLSNKGTLLFLLTLAGACTNLNFDAFAEDRLCEARAVDGTSYTVCDADPRRLSVRVHYGDPDGVPLKTFENLAHRLWLDDYSLLRLAMNGGMYHPDFRPVGLLVENGDTVSPLNDDGGEGNFFLKPNGVFFITTDGAGVLETTAFRKSGIHPVFATQSGPMLVIDGKIHPAFREGSESLKKRNGVCVDNRGHVLLAVAETDVNFFSFAIFFRDTLHCENALFLDGTISSLMQRDSGRMDNAYPLGPMISVEELQAQ